MPVQRSSWNRPNSHGDSQPCSPIRTAISGRCDQRQRPDRRHASLRAAGQVAVGTWWRPPRGGQRRCTDVSACPTLILVALLTSERCVPDAREVGVHMSEHGSFTDEPSLFDDDETSSGESVIRIASVAALGGLLFGYDSAVINGAVSAIQDQFSVGSTVLGLAVASVLLGAATGAMTAGRFADRFGRLFVMKVAAVLFLVSAFGAGLSPNLEVLVVFRVIGGLGVGAASVIAPAYIAEISPPRIRGRLGSLQQLAIVSGIFLSLLVDYLLANAAGGSRNVLALGQEAWRWMFIAMAIPALAYGLLALTIPESPRYLVAKHRIPEARRVLTALLGEKNLEITVNRIQRTLSQENPPSWGDLKRSGTGLLPIVWVGLALSVFQQAVGINVIFYYSNVLWEAVGFSEGSAFTITVITSVVNIATTLIAIG